jgi:hypothetical protein
VYIKEHILVIVQARNDRNLNFYIGSRNKEHWIDLKKCQLIEFDRCEKGRNEE